ncbi:unnamed protein product, partial [Brassica oleracea]
LYWPEILRRKQKNVPYEERKVDTLWFLYLPLSGAPGRRKSHAESKGEKGRRIRELTSLVEKRFRFPQDSVELYVEKVANRGLCAIAQAESLRYKLLGGLAVCSCECLLISVVAGEVSIYNL